MDGTKIEKLLAELAEQRERIEKGKLFGEATEDIGLNAKVDFGCVSEKPISEHPRLLLRAEMLPLMRKKLEEDTPTNRYFRETLCGEIKGNGVLAPAVEHLTGRKGVHNFDAGVLESIIIKALGYLLCEEPRYGYEAILGLKNFLLTLDLQHIYSDQCREYGYVLFVSACVYDWCYPLLTALDRHQLIAGAETRIASGNSREPVPGIHPVYCRRIEVGFPPSDQGSVSGHGSERQILRDFLAFAVAIYGENDSWWEYIGARVYNDYVPVRNYYYRSGMSQQGTGQYICGRHISDLYSAWILEAAVGHHPYVGMAPIVHHIFGYECRSGECFADGDGTFDSKPQKAYQHLARIAAYLFRDPCLLRWSEDLLGENALGPDPNYLDAALYVALRGFAELSPAEDRYAKMELIQYNGSPIGQYISRRAWNDPDGCAAFTKLKEITTANHEHKDAGTFELYYKGSLTSDGGCYNNYGHAHTQMFHQMTIAHNGLIVFNPEKLKPDSELNAERYYSGGQFRSGEMKDLAAWLGSPAHRTGRVSGHAHAYYDAERTLPHYAYIGGEITGAYERDTVNYVGRRMLTLYTNDESAPMALFVYDDVESVKADYEKRFLLQISSKEEPTVSGNRIVTENGGGRLVYTTLSDGMTLRPLGGRAYTAEGKYDPDASRNYMLNGENLRSLSGADDGHWGRVEVIAPSEAQATFLSAMYVTDRGSGIEKSVSRIDGEGLVGVCYDGKHAVLFATARNAEDVTELALTLPGDGEMTVYVSGVAPGAWHISCDAVELSTEQVTPRAGLLVFRAPAGALTMSRIS